MAVSATFAADFSSFNSAIDKADVKLRGLDTSAKFVEKGLNRLVDQFSGRKLIQEATLMTDAVEKIGGTAKLTEKELVSIGNKAAEAAEKMKKMGVEVPPKLADLAKAAEKPVSAFGNMLDTIKKIGPALGVSLSVGAITSFAKGVGEFAGKMVDLNAQTQISTTRLQAFNFAGAGVGLTIDDIAGSADQLSKRLGGDDKSVNEALRRLNLSAEELKQLSLDEVIFKIDEGLKGVGNQFERSRILADLFGRSGAQMGRLLDGSLQQAITSIEKTGAVIDEELIRKADAFDDAWSQMWIKFRAYSATAVGFAIDQISRLGPVITEVGRAMREDATSNFGTPGASPVITSRTGPRLQAPRRIGLGSTAPDLILGSGIKSIEAREAADKEAADASKAFAEATKKGALATEAWVREMHNARGEMLMQQDAAVLNAATSTATQKLQALALRGLPGLPASAAGVLQSGNIATSLAMFGPGALTSRGGGGGLGAGSLVRPTSIGGSLRNVLGGLPDVVLGALQGGGNVTKSIGSLLGGSLLGGGTGLNKALSGGISSLLGKTVGGLASSILPGIGALLGPAISGLTKVFGGLFGGAGKATNRARDAKIAELTGISGDKGASQEKFRSMASAAGVSAGELDKLFSTKNAQAFERQLDSITKKIEKYGDEQHKISAQAEADAQRLETAIAKYGFTLEELGPTLQRQKLNEQAQELIEDWNVLISAGVEVGTVNTRMAESINKYLQTALKVGVEVPAAMRPLLQQFADQGLLTDEAGNAITDLEKAGVKFSETMTQGFDRVVKKLDELIDRIYGVGTAIGDIPPVPTIADPNAYSQSDLGPAPIPMASGGRGRVTSPTLFMAGEGGPEDVAFSGAGRRLGGGSDPALVDAVTRLSGDMNWLRSNLHIALRDAVLLTR